jgi:drug/metabolite transporter (DMT)-like permease
MWLVIALLGNALLATVGVIDKLILTKAVSKPIIFVFYSTIFVLPVFLLIPFGVIALPMWSADYAIFIVSGLCFAFGLWAMYVAIAKGEVSRIGPLIGAATPLFILCLGNIFLQERLGKFALIASVFLIVGSLVISFEKKKHNRLGMQVWSGLCFPAFYLPFRMSAPNMHIPRMVLRVVFC